MESQTLTPSGSGPRACRACAAGKAKCVFPPATSHDDTKCTRCTRLLKQCILQTPAVRKRQPRTSTRVAQLEEKLEGLESLLKNTQSPIDGNAAEPVFTSFQPSTQTIPYANSDLFPTRFSTAGSRESVACGDPVHADALLLLYRTNMSPQFPFVIIPDHMSAIRLAQDKPFLYKTVLMVASYHDKSVQTLMANEIFEYLSAHMIIRNEKTLDLLQGLLVLIAWYHTHIHVARRITLMLQLAAALEIDLGLSPKAAVRIAENRAALNLRTFLEDIPIITEPTSEERRTYLGLVFLNSVISTFVTDTSDPGYSAQYTDDCVMVLQKSLEFPSDQILLHLVELQRIAQEINQILPRYIAKLSSNPPIPASSSLRALQMKLETFRNHLPLQIQQNPFILMHYHSLLAYLTELALSIPFPSRQATLQACLTATHSFFTIMFSVPLTDYYKLTYFSWMQVRNIIVVLCKLSSFESPDWDPSHVRGVLDLSLILDNMISQFEKIQVWRIKQGQGTSDVFLERFIPRLKQYREAFQRKSQSLLGDPNALSQLSIEPMSHIPMDDLQFGQLDEAFWGELVFDWNNPP